MTIYNLFTIHLQSITTIYNPFTIHYDQLQSIYNPFTIQLQSITTIYNSFTIQLQSINNQLQSNYNPYYNCPKLNYNIFTKAVAVYTFLIGQCPENCDISVTYHSGYAFSGDSGVTGDEYRHMGASMVYDCQDGVKAITFGELGD